MPNSAMQPIETNYSFEYRHIRHIGEMAQFESEKAFQDSVVKKYEDLDAGRNKKAPAPEKSE